MSNLYELYEMEDEEAKQQKIREQRLGRMMSQMSMSYPVMQIMGYQKIDAGSNLLITENDSFSFYPKKTRTTTAQELKTDS